MRLQAPHCGTDWYVWDCENNCIIPDVYIVDDELRVYVQLVRNSVGRVQVDLDGTVMRREYECKKIVILLASRIVYINPKEDPIAIGVLINQLIQPKALQKAG